MKILNQLLWSGKNKWQIIGAAAGSFIGLFLLLSALQLYFDLQGFYSSMGDTNSLDSCTATIHGRKQNDMDPA